MILCCMCGKPLNSDNEPHGIILVRMKVYVAVDDRERWDSVPICTPDWHKDNGDRVPHRVRWDGVNALLNA